jgi:LmbE family N-acetylglucosaminyl deacetylase
MAASGIQLHRLAYGVTVSFIRPGFRLTEGEIAPRRVDQLLYRMRGLRSIGNVLHVGTHPDDEDAGLMAYMSHKYGARTVYWSATRGEGGQNRLGLYTGEALGIYRTWESLAARAIDGGESFYGPFFDFGFSKNGAEATAKWGRQELVREIVRAIRLVQPQVLIARFTGEPSDGHGQHQAVGSATLEAFDAAADATLFPELGLPAWETPKLYQSTGGDWQPGEENSLGKLRPEFECDAFLRIDTGELDPIVGLTYQQQAWIAFNCHQTQAVGFLPTRGSFYYYYKLKKSRVATKAPEKSFYDGLDPTLLGLLNYRGVCPPDLGKTLEAVRASVDAALARLHPDDPSAAAGALVQGLDLLRKLRAQIDSGTRATCDWRPLAQQVDDKIACFEEVIVGCLGLDAECIAERAHVAAGESVGIIGRLWNSRGVRIDASYFKMMLPVGWNLENAAPKNCPSGFDVTSLEKQVDYQIKVAADAPPATPYWLTEPRGLYHYTTSRDSFACEAFGPAAVALECELVLDGHRLSLRRPALQREPFAGGYRERRLSVLPAISVNPPIANFFFPVRRDHYDLDLFVVLHRHVSHPGPASQLWIKPPEGWSASPLSLDLPTGSQGESLAARFRLTIPGGTVSGRYRIEYRLGSGDGRPAVTLDPVWMGAPGLSRPPDAATCVRETFLARTAHVDVHIISAKFATGCRYGYVRGAAEGLVDALSNFGLNIHIMNDEELDCLDLSGFDAIVIGPNAYLIRDALRQNAGRFLDYVSKGGTLIVQYQAYGYELHGFTPYPFDFSHPHDRVTYPDAPVSILEPQHPLMTYPNKITEEDFAGWIHDRGLYFLGKFDDRYTAILGCSDPGEDLRRGGLLASGYGRGAFVYVGYSLFRQIPAAVPGAFRLLANLMALPEALLLERVERLRKLSFFSSLSDEQLMAVAKIVSERFESAGAYLCRQGDAGQELFIVTKGEVEIVKQTANGAVSLRAGEGQVIGEFAILADIPRTADLRALTDVRLLVISGIHFRALIRQSVEIAESVIRQLVAKLTVE